MGLMGNYRTGAIGYYKLVKKLRRYHAGQLQYFGHAHLSGTTSRNPGLSPVWKKSCIAKLRMVGFRAVVGKVKPKARNQKPDPEQLLAPISRPSRNGNDKEPDRWPGKSRSEGVQLLDATGKN